MSKISCTFVKCIYNQNGKSGYCSKEQVQIGGFVDPKEEPRTVKPICADYKPVS